MNKPIKHPTISTEPAPTEPTEPLTPFDAGFASDVPLAGRWVAWDQRQQKVLAVADTFAEVMECIPDANDPDLVVGVAPGVAPEVAARPFELLPDESADVTEDVKNMIGDGYERWLDTPHFWLNGRTPRSVIGTEQEEELRYLLRHLRYGIPT